MMYIDLLFITLIIFFGIVGYIKGFLNQVLSVLLILTVIFFAKPLADWLKYDSGYSWFQKAPALMLWATSAFFFFLATVGIGALIRAIKKSQGLMPFDHWMGLTLGVVKGFIFMVALGVFFLTLPEDSRAQFADLNGDSRKSYLMKVSESVMEWDSLASIKSLKQIQNKMEADEVELEKVGRDLFEQSSREPEQIISEKDERSAPSRPIPWKKPTEKNSR